jgi:hypothetical protein
MADVLGATTNLLSTAASLGSSFGSLGLGLPAPNILSNFASYNYVISLHPLTINQLNFPDASYKAGAVLPIICKSAGADPDNRIQTNLGKHDFFINNLTFESVIGLNTTKATNVSIIQFDVYEPYSIGLFLLALQTAATNALGPNSNWRDAPFLLSIEFRGNKESGSIVKVPFSTRHIPIRFTTVKMTSNEQGTRYLINAYAAQGQALTTDFASLKTDTVIKGKTVQEVLQTGEQSLQTVVNKKLQEYVKDKSVSVADQIVILFPKEESIASSAAPAAAGGGESKTNNKAYINPQINNSNTEIFSKLGVSPSTLQQSLSSVNEIGSTDMGFSQVRRGDPPQGNPSDTWDPVTKSWLRGKLIIDEKTGTFKFSQETDIPTVINQILLASSYAATALKPGADKDGFVTWWRIDTQMFYVDSKENMDKSGTLPKIAVYRVVPFKVHLSKVAGPNVKMPGFDQLKKNAVKRYDYLFTGNNSEVLKFDIDFSIGFANALAADGNKNSTDVDRQEQTATADQNQNPELNPNPAGEKSNVTIPGQQNTQVKRTATKTSTDGKGGGGTDTQVQRIGRTFHDAITNPYDMIVLDLEIMGDPYWIVSSGMGNYTSKSVDGVKDLNKDGSVNWQTSEVDVIVNFRSPIDINQTTGMYDFKGPNIQDMTKNPKAGPAIGFTGLYCVNLVTSTFRNGEFRQTLKGYRRNGQEYKKEGTGRNAINTGTPAESQQGKSTPGGDRGTRGGA